MNSPCGFLEISPDGLYSCSIYDDKRRPRTCRLTQPEGSHCRTIQDEAASAFLAGGPDYPAIDLIAVLANEESLNLEFNQTRILGG
ncbi:hypothetical protein A3F65_02460 [Candidatus Saccharibacteria bacterium RIFCSPHIGHO2_12_FULL_47_16b]|nr:MAG: hypothetical protein A3F65_02460 [Candidatus Saccharibacteria bacterium RIFCSPHIGHO2_12_FULL_47_16b]